MERISHPVIPSVPASLKSRLSIFPLGKPFYSCVIFVSIRNSFIFVFIDFLSKCNQIYGKK